MKTILVLTDFTKNAMKAAETATILAVQLNAEVLLFNADATIPLVPNYPYTVPLDENILWKKSCEKQMNSIISQLKKRVPTTDGNKPLVIRSMIKEGDLVANVNDLLRKFRIEMIVMGAPSGGKGDHLLFGSDTNAVLDHVNCPVVVVPLTWPVNTFKKVIFASNFIKQDLEVIKYLIKLSGIFHFKLQVVHVKLYGAPDPFKDEQVLLLISKIQEAKYPSASYLEVRGKDVLNRITDLCKESGADLLAFTHEHRSLLIRMLRAGTVKRSVSNPKIPVMIFSNVKEKTAIKASPGLLTGYVFSIA